MNPEFRKHLEKYINHPPPEVDMNEPEDYTGHARDLINLHETGMRFRNDPPPPREEAIAFKPAREEEKLNLFHLRQQTAPYQQAIANTMPDSTEMMTGTKPMNQLAVHQGMVDQGKIRTHNWWEEGIQQGAPSAAAPARPEIAKKFIKHNINVPGVHAVGPTHTPSAAINYRPVQANIENPERYTMDASVQYKQAAPQNAKPGTGKRLQALSEMYGISGNTDGDILPRNRATPAPSLPTSQRTFSRVGGFSNGSQPNALPQGRPIKKGHLVSVMPMPFDLNFTARPTAAPVPIPGNKQPVFIPKLNIDAMNYVSRPTSYNIPLKNSRLPTSNQIDADTQISNRGQPGLKPRRIPIINPMGLNFGSSNTVHSAAGMGMSVRRVAPMNLEGSTDTSGDHIVNGAPRTKSLPNWYNSKTILDSAKFGDSMPGR